MENRSTNNALAAATEAPQQQQPSAGNADLDALLAEYDSGTKPAAPPAQQQSEPDIPQLEHSRDFDALRANVDVLQRGQVGIVSHFERQRNVADFENVVKIGHQELKDEGITVSQERIDRWLRAEAMLNPELRKAFDERYQSGAHQRRAEKVIRNVVQKMQQEIRSEPDPSLTADRMAVAAAVRGGGRYVPSGDKPPDYSNMTPQEFEKAKDDALNQAHRGQRTRAFNG
jgi:hypothetical protein